MITLTCVRHGQTVDNVGQVWAGWKDSELTELGMNQARAVGAYFGDKSTGIHVHAIYASPLSRAYFTAQQIQSQQPTTHKPPLTPSDLLKEQFWGDAEGHPLTWEPPPPTKPDEDVDTDSSGKYAPLTLRTSRFPNGESSDDVARRVDRFISEFLIPHVLASLPDEEPPLNIFVVSHGIAIAELIGALLRRDPSAEEQAPETWRGLVNTGWTRLEVKVCEKPAARVATSTPPSDTPNLVHTETQLTNTTENSHPSPVIPSAEAKQPDPLLSVCIREINQSSHLANIVSLSLVFVLYWISFYAKRHGPKIHGVLNSGSDSPIRFHPQNGGLANSTDSPTQASSNDFFGGGTGGRVI